MKACDQLWLEQGGAKVSTCSKEHIAHCLETLRGKGTVREEKKGGTNI